MKKKEKDPAFLMYSADFLIGTMRFTNAQTGIYIKLLCLQHQTGYLTKEDFYKECEGVEEDIQAVMSKFHIDAEGNILNPRLAREMVKRKETAIKNSENAKKRWNKDKSQSDRITNAKQNECIALENENENENNIKTIDSLEDLYED